MDERELLSHYLRDGSADAYAALVRRYASLVYSAARRQLGDSHLAEDVTQAVFLLLAKKARSVRGPLAGWLIATTVHACRNARKMALRRQFHERRAAQMTPEATVALAGEWEDYAPMLDQALASLKSADRDAVTLRFLVGLSVEQVGSELGINKWAARKRVDRALARLRKIISAKAAVPAVAVLAAHLTTRGAEAAPAKMVETIAASGASAVKGTLAGAIAQKTGAAMTWAKVKIAAMVVTAFGIIAAGTGALVITTEPSIPASPPTTQAQAAPATRQAVAGEDESRVPGVLQAVRWEVLLNADGLTALKQAESSPVQTQSRVYQAAIYRGAILRAAMAQAIAVDGVALAISPEVTRQDALRGPLEIDSSHRFYTPYPYLSDGDWRVTMNYNVQGQAALSYAGIGNDQIHLKVNFTQINVQLRERNARVPKQTSAKMAFEGNLGAGEAIGFLGAFTVPSGQTYFHLIVWETFKAEPWQMKYFHCATDIGWWCQNSPEKLRALANAAVVWTAGATHEPSQVPAACEQNLPDGIVVRLTSVSGGGRWPFCRWDGDGQPVADYPGGLGNSSQQPQYLADIEVHGPPEVWEHQAPPGLGGSNVQVPVAIPRGDYETTIEVSSDDTGAVSVGVPVGPWQEVGKLNVGGSIFVDGITYVLQSANKIEDKYIEVQLELKESISHGGLVTLTAVGSDGVELSPYGVYAEPVYHDEPMTSASLRFRGKSPDEIEFYRVWLRKRQWVTFKDFAHEPALPPRMDVTPDEVAAARAIVLQREHAADQLRYAQKIQLMAAVRKQWEAIPPDPATPKGALRAMFQAAEAGDLQSVRHRMIAGQPDPEKRIDWYARLITVDCATWRLAAHNFGEAALMAELVKVPGVLDEQEHSFMQANWQPLPDGGLTSDNGLSVIKAENGEYYLDVTEMVKQPADSDLYGKILLKTESLYQWLKAHPSATLDQFEEELQRPISAISTGQ